MNLSSDENARNVDLRASLSKLESDIKSFSKILQKTSSSSKSRKGSASSFDDSDDSISDIDSSTMSYSSNKKSPMKFKDIAHAVILRRRRRKVATLKKWDGTEIDEWILSPNSNSMSRLAIISLNNESSRPYKTKKKRSSVKIEHSTSQTNMQYPSTRRSSGEYTRSQSHPLTYSEPDQVLNCLCSCLAGRPVLALFLLIMFNGVISMICSAIIVKIEKPAQDQRFKERDLLQNKVNEYERNLSMFISVKPIFKEEDPEVVVGLLSDYEEVVAELYTYPDEIPWGILSAQSFITSIQTTTGNGDIVPMTTEGKIFTLIYATYGIPLFLWYIFKLGGLFRILVINAGYAICRCFWLDFPESKRKVSPGTGSDSFPSPSEIFSSSGQVKADELGASLDARFHPSIIGIILLIFLLSVSAFISHIENISYFDSVYASFISYSTIGFGDIDIFQYSFRSNWLNFFIYGNGVHIIGYMIVSAYVTSILEKFGVRKF